MIQVYYATAEGLSDSELFSRGLTMVGPLRRQKIERLKGEKDRCLSLMAGLLLCWGLRPYGIWEPEMAMVVGEHGKPGLLPELGLCYSLTHAGDYAAMAISDHSVGIDIEQMQRFKRRQEQGKEQILMKRVLSLEEQEQMDLISGDAVIEEMTKIWTCKEAYAKEDGRGLSMDFRTIDTTCRERFFSTLLEKDYWMTVYPAEKEEIRIREVQIQSLFQ